MFALQTLQTADQSEPTANQEDSKGTGQMESDVDGSVKKNHT